MALWLMFFLAIIITLVCKWQALRNTSDLRPGVSWGTLPVLRSGSVAPGALREGQSLFAMGSCEASPSLCLTARSTPLN